MLYHSQQIENDAPRFDFFSTPPPRNNANILHSGVTREASMAARKCTAYKPAPLPSKKQYDKKKMAHMAAKRCGVVSVPPPPPPQKHTTKKNGTIRPRGSQTKRRCIRARPPLPSLRNHETNKRVKKHGAFRQPSQPTTPASEQATTHVFI